MTLTELRYVVAIARERHFGRAAEACFVSQPTLSVAVRKLETELDIKLFERTGSEVVATAVGQRVIEQASRVLEEADRVKAIAAEGRDPLAGTLRLGVIFTVGPYLLPHLVPRLRQRAPDMPLIIEENYTANLAEQLRHGAVDAVILSLPFEHTGVLTRALYEEPFRVLMPTSHPWAARARIAAPELADEELLLLGQGHCFRDQVLRACPECQYRHAGDGRGLQRSMEGSSLETIRHMVASGLGITVLPASSVNGPDDELLSVRDFEAPAPGRVIGLAWRRSFPRPEAIELLHQTVMECAIPGVTPAAETSVQARPTP